MHQMQQKSSGKVVPNLIVELRQAVLIWHFLIYLSG